MCLICVEYEKQRISLKMAYKHLAEMREDLGEEHAQEVEDMLDHDFAIQIDENATKAREEDPDEEEDEDDYYEWYEEHGFGD